MPIAKKHIKVQMETWSNYGKPGYVGKAFNGTAEKQCREGQKLPGNNAPRMWSERRIQRLCDAQEHPFYNSSSGSNARKAASAAIAKIPFALSSYIARTYLPDEEKPDAVAGLFTA